MNTLIKKLSFSSVALLALLYTNLLQAEPLISQSTCNSVSHSVDFGGGIELMKVEAEAAGGAAWQLVFVGEVNVTAEIALMEVGIAAGTSAEFSLSVCVDTVELADMLNNGLLTPEQSEAAQLYLGQQALSLQQQDGLRHSLMTYAGVTAVNVRSAEAGLRPAAILIDGMYRSVTGELSALDMIDEGVNSAKSIVQMLPVPAKLENRIKNFEQTMAKRFTQAELGLDEFCDPAVINSGNAVASVFKDLCGEIAELSDTARELQNTVKLLGDFGKDVGTQLAGLSKTVNRVSSSMGQVSGNVANVKNKLDASFSQIQNAVNRVTAVGGTAQSSLQTAGGNLATAASNIQQAIDVVKTTTLDVIDGVVKDIDDVGKTINSLIQPVITAVQDFPAAVLSFFQNLIP